MACAYRSAGKAASGLAVHSGAVDKACMTSTAPASEGLVRLTHIMYALHTFSAVMGLISAGAVVTAFLTGWPSIIAVVLNYAKRGDARGSFVESHLSWQLRTFWYAVLWFLIAVVLFLTVLGIPLAFLIIVVAGIWVLYRLVRGWLALNDGRAIAAS
jgi:uncharacterized membrane protein